MGISSNNLAASVKTPFFAYIERREFQMTKAFCSRGLKNSWVLIIEAWREEPK
jgi:hypothetical protein